MTASLNVYSLLNYHGLPGYRLRISAKYLAKARRALRVDGVIWISPKMARLLNDDDEGFRRRVMAAIDVVPVDDLAQAWREAF